MWVYVLNIIYNKMIHCIKFMSVKHLSLDLYFIKIIKYTERKHCLVTWGDESSKQII